MGEHLRADAVEPPLQGSEPLRARFPGADDQRGPLVGEQVEYVTRFSDVDVVIDLVGDEVAATSQRSLRVLAPGGHLVAVPSGLSPELAIAAASLGVRGSPFLVEPDGPALTQLAALIDQRALRVEVPDVLPLERAATAHTQLATGRTRGKLVLRVG